jgi:hypothetical protein
MRRRDHKKSINEIKQSLETDKYVVFTQIYVWEIVIFIPLFVLSFLHKKVFLSI